MVTLDTVTLLGMDSINIHRLTQAALKCNQNIRFKAVKLLGNLDIPEMGYYRIPPLKCIEDYSKFVMKELYKYVDTEHVLIIHHDGYIVNPSAWNSEWLSYDYIGAPWSDRPQERCVGNGGFCLRSRRLLEIIATDPFITEFHPEDKIICRTYGEYLESKYFIKFAPKTDADKFSTEGWTKNQKQYNGEFGFHGKHVLNLPI